MKCCNINKRKEKKTRGIKNKSSKRKYLEVISELKKIIQKNLFF